jgi:hypothetical protein
MYLQERYTLLQIWCWIDNRGVAGDGTIKDTHLVKLELLSNATTIDSALNYIGNKQQQKGLALDSTTNDDPVSFELTYPLSTHINTTACRDLLLCLLT